MCGVPLRDTFRRASRWACPGLLLATAVAACAGAWNSGRAAELPGLPDLIRTQHRTFAIPFRLPKSQDPDADATPQRILLQVSKDLGGTWEHAGEAAPTQGSLTYTASDDGEYWFRLRAVDRKGRTRGGEGPDMRVLVDAAGPKLTARVWKGADGEIVCRYAAVDDSLRLESLKLEYRGPGDKAWKTVATEGILARQAPAHLVGEEIWWVGEKVESLAVRIAIADSSGNPTVRQFSLLAADPGVDQAALAKELGVLPLPVGPPADGPATAVIAPPAEPAASAGDGFASSPRGWSSERGGVWADGRPQTTSAAGAGTDRGRSVLVKQSGDGGASAPVASASRTAAAETKLATPTANPVADAAGADGGAGLEYKGRPLLLSRSRRFAWDYETPREIRTAGPLRAELWSTRDGGVTWQRTAVDDDGRSPIDVQLPAAGLYGFRLEMVADQVDADAGPRSGEAPDAWVGIDEEPPQVELLGVDRDDAAQPAALVIRYAARDAMLAPRSARLLYSPNPDGPWATIAADLEPQGEYRWQPGRSVPARVFLRVEASDAAGNLGSGSTPDAVAVAATRVVGRLGGLRAEPQSPAAAAASSAQFPPPPPDQARP
jgi:hypothetical protein